MSVIFKLIKFIKLIVIYFLIPRRSCFNMYRTIHNSSLCVLGTLQIALTAACSHMGSDFIFAVKMNKDCKIPQSRQSFTGLLIHHWHDVRSQTFGFYDSLCGSLRSRFQSIVSDLMIIVLDLLSIDYDKKLCRFWVRRGLFYSITKLSIDSDKLPYRLRWNTYFKNGAYFVRRGMTSL